MHFDRPQHLATLELIASLCKGTLSGGNVSSTEITLEPGIDIGNEGTYHINVGTAGFDLVNH